MTTNSPLATRRARIAIATAIMLIGLGGSTTLAKTTLRWKFKEGDVLHYSMDQTTISTGQDPSGRRAGSRRSD